MSTTTGSDESPTHWHDAIDDDVAGRLNWLRAAVLGANDGIISTAGVVMGVAGATNDSEAILIAGIAALTAGAISMAAGEYVSVSTQRDSEKSMLAMESHELKQMPEVELAELTTMLREKGLSAETAATVATELTEHDALAAHAEIEFGIDPKALTNPWKAAWASMFSFTLGALLPLLTVAFVPAEARIAVTVGAVILALAAAGFVSAKLGYSPRLPAVIRNVAGGLLAMAITYLVGMAFGTQLG